MANRVAGIEVIAARLAADEGLRHFMVVISVRHHLGAAWKPLVKALRAMQTAMRKGDQWKQLVAGYLRLLESTYGRNGHHPHEHILISLRVDEDWDPTAFFDWIESICARQARKAGRTTDWQKGWWSEVPRECLVKAIRYLAEADKMGTSIPVLREIASAASKHQPIWTIKPKAFAEIWRESKGMKWFGVGGCWASKDLLKTDGELNDERQEVGRVVAHIPVDTWRNWTPKERRDRLSIITNRAIPWPELVPELLAWGGILGIPVDPWEGVPF
jgi:hypothetical protein